MTYTDAVNVIAQSSGPGRYICPKCCGGTEGEQSLSIRAEDGVLHWRCFRSTCGFAGGPRGVASVFSGPRKEPRVYTRPIRPLTVNHCTFIHDKFGIDPHAISGYDYDADRFLLEVGSSAGTRRGYVAYSFNEKPKTLTYNELPDEPFIHYTGIARHPAIVVVEDWFSAEKVHEAGVAIGAALMGTNLSQDGAAELAALAERWKAKVFVALDRDAYTKSLLYLSRFKEMFPNGIYAWALNVDLKYEPVERIKRALINGEYDFTDRINRGGNSWGDDTGPEAA